MFTVFITISRGSIARNILHSDAFRILRERGIRIVLLAPAWEDPQFQKEFGGENVAFVPLLDQRQNFLDRIIVGIAKGLVYNATTELRDRYGFLSRKETSPFRRFIKRLIFRPLRNVGWLKEMMRQIDAILRPAREYDALFRAEHPGLIFVTNPTENADARVMKAARRHGVKVVAMPKSWDNLPKLSLRVKPDLLLLWGKALIPHALRYQHIEESRIRLVGVPQFDAMTDPKMAMTREEFFRSIGADPNRKLIVFGSEGKVTPGDPELAEILAGMVERDELGSPSQLYIRPYFALRGEEDKFRALAGRPNVIIDHWFTRTAGFRDSWDYTLEHARHFTNLMRHMDVMVCHASTLTLDAAVHNKPAVNLGFDGFTPKSYGDSVLRWYDSAHYANIMAQKGSRLAKNPAELREHLTAYLQNSSLDDEGRARLREQYCFRSDGGAGRRIAEVLLPRSAVPAAGES